MCAQHVRRLLKVSRTSDNSIIQVMMIDVEVKATGWTPEFVIQVWEEEKHAELVILDTSIQLDFQESLNG